MKVNVLLDNAVGIRDDYINVDPFANSEDSRVRDNIKSLSEIDDGEAEEVLALDVLHYFTFGEIPQVLAAYSRKLAHGGTLVVSFVDIYYVIKAIANRSLSLEEANRVLHGVSDKPWHLRKSTLSMDYVCELLQSAGLRIICKKYVEGKALVRALRA